MPTDNGILAYVGGQYISSGGRMLPQACAAEAADPIRSVVLDVPDLGPVRVTYRLSSYRHYKDRHWHWLAEHAERAAPQARVTAARPSAMQ